MDKKFVPRSIAARHPPRHLSKAKAPAATAASFNTRNWEKLDVERRDVASGPLSAGSTEVSQAPSKIGFSLPPESQATEKKHGDLEWLATPPLERQPPPDEVLKLPIELFYSVIALLPPIERVALALTSKQLATVVISWASGRPANPPLHPPQQLLLNGPTTARFRLVVPDGTTQTLVSFPHFASTFALTATESRLPEHRNAPKVLACSECLSFSHTAPTGYHISAPPLVDLTELRKTMMEDLKVRWLLMGDTPATTRLCVWCHRDVPRQRELRHSSLSCIRCKADAYVRWCEKCLGPVDDYLQVARLYWKTQERG